uniref:protein piccolo n=1 Tax=Myxine glutinosa TaxID=7769 RepID=UPI003590293B
MEESGDKAKEKETNSAVVQHHGAYNNQGKKGQKRSDQETKGFARSLSPSPTQSTFETSLGGHDTWNVQKATSATELGAALPLPAGKSPSFGSSSLSVGTLKSPSGLCYGGEQGFATLSSPSRGRLDANDWTHSAGGPAISPSAYQVPRLAPVPRSTEVCPICTTTELKEGGDDEKPNFNRCTQCKTVVCNHCGFNPNPHLNQVQEWLCLNCQMQRALGMDMLSPPKTRGLMQYMDGAQLPQPEAKSPDIITMAEEQRAEFEKSAHIADYDSTEQQKAEEAKGMHKGENDLVEQQKVEWEKARHKDDQHLGRPHSMERERTECRGNRNVFKEQKRAHKKVTQKSDFDLVQQQQKVESTKAPFRCYYDLVSEQPGGWRGMADEFGETDKAAPQSLRKDTASEEKLTLKETEAIKVVVAQKGPQMERKSGPVKEDDKVAAADVASLQSPVSVGKMKKQIDFEESSVEGKQKGVRDEGQILDGQGMGLSYDLSPNIDEDDGQIAFTMVQAIQEHSANGSSSEKNHEMLATEDEVAKSNGLPSQPRKGQVPPLSSVVPDAAVGQGEQRKPQNLPHQNPILSGKSTSRSGAAMQQQESGVTGKLFGFGASLLSQASSLIATAQATAQATVQVSTQSNSNSPAKGLANISSDGSVKSTGVSTMASEQSPHCDLKGTISENKHEDRSKVESPADLPLQDEKRPVEVEKQPKPLSDNIFETGIPVEMAVPSVSPISDLKSAVVSGDKVVTVPTAPDKLGQVKAHTMTEIMTPAIPGTMHSTALQGTADVKPTEEISQLTKRAVGIETAPSTTATNTMVSEPLPHEKAIDVNISSDTVKDTTDLGAPSLSMANTIAAELTTSDWQERCCPICGAELTDGRSGLPNYNACTECSQCVCNCCGFNPAPHLLEKKEWLCLTCQTQRALAGQLGFGEVTIPSTVSKVKPVNNEDLPGECALDGHQQVREPPDRKLPEVPQKALDSGVEAKELQDADVRARHQLPQRGISLSGAPVMDQDELLIAPEGKIDEVPIIMENSIDVEDTVVGVSDTIAYVNDPYEDKESEENASYHFDTEKEADKKSIITFEKESFEIPYSSSSDQQVTTLLLESGQSYELAEGMLEIPGESLKVFQDDIDKPKELYDIRADGEQSPVALSQAVHISNTQFSAGPLNIRSHETLIPETREESFKIPFAPEPTVWQPDKQNEEILNEQSVEHLKKGTYSQLREEVEEASDEYHILQDTYMEICLPPSTKDLLMEEEQVDWDRKFKSGVSSVADAARSGWSHTAITPEMVAGGERVLRKNRRITLDEVVSELNISHGSAHHIIHNMLAFHRVCKHDNARPHTARTTAATIEDLHFECLPHPPHSPDLTPSDYHILGLLKAALRGTTFRSDEEVQEAVHEWLRKQPKDYFSPRGIQALVDGVKDENGILPDVTFSPTKAEKDLLSVGIPTSTTALDKLEYTVRSLLEAQSLELQQKNGTDIKVHQTLSEVAKQTTRLASDAFSSDEGDLEYIQEDNKDCLEWSRLISHGVQSPEEAAFDEKVCSEISTPTPVPGGDEEGVLGDRSDSPCSLDDDDFIRRQIIEMSADEEGSLSEDDKTQVKDIFTHHRIMLGESVGEEDANVDGSSKSIERPSDSQHHVLLREPSSSYEEIRYEELEEGQCSWGRDRDDVFDGATSPDIPDPSASADAEGSSEASTPQALSTGIGGLRRFKTIDLKNSIPPKLSTEDALSLGSDFDEPELEMESLTDSPDEHLRSGADGEAGGGAAIGSGGRGEGTSPVSVSSFEEDSDSSPSQRRRGTAEGTASGEVGRSSHQRKTRHRTHGPPLLPTIEDSSEEDELREEEATLREQETLRAMQHGDGSESSRRSKRDKEELRARRRQERTRTSPSNLSPIEDASPTEELRHAAEMEELQRSSCSEYSPSLESEPDASEWQSAAISSEETLPPLKTAEEVYQELMWHVCLSEEPMAAPPRPPAEGSEAPHEDVPEAISDSPPVTHEVEETEASAFTQRVQSDLDALCCKLSEEFASLPTTTTKVAELPDAEAAYEELLRRLTPVQTNKDFEFNEDPLPVTVSRTDSLSTNACIFSVPDVTITQHFTSEDDGDWEIPPSISSDSTSYEPLEFASSDGPSSDEPRRDDGISCSESLISTWDGSSVSTEISMGFEAMDDGSFIVTDALVKFSEIVETSASEMTISDETTMYKAVPSVEPEAFKYSPVEDLDHYHQERVIQTPIADLPTDHTEIKMPKLDQPVCLAETFDDSETTRDIGDVFTVDGVDSTRDHEQLSETTTFKKTSFDSQRSRSMEAFPFIAEDLSVSIDKSLELSVKDNILPYSQIPLPPLPPPPPPPQPPLQTSPISAMISARKNNSRISTEPCSISKDAAIISDPKSSVSTIPATFPPAAQRRIPYSTSPPVAPKPLFISSEMVTTKAIPPPVPPKPSISALSAKFGRPTDPRPSSTASSPSVSPHTLHYYRPSLIQETCAVITLPSDPLEASSQSRPLSTVVTRNVGELSSEKIDLPLMINSSVTQLPTEVSLATFPSALVQSTAVPSVRNKSTTTLSAIVPSVMMKSTTSPSVIVPPVTNKSPSVIVPSVTNKSTTLMSVIVPSPVTVPTMVVESTVSPLIAPSHIVPTLTFATTKAGSIIAPSGEEQFQIVPTPTLPAVMIEAATTLSTVLPSDTKPSAKVPITKETSTTLLSMVEKPMVVLCSTEKTQDLQMTSPAEAIIDLTLKRYSSVPPPPSSSPLIIPPSAPFLPTYLPVSVDLSLPCEASTNEVALTQKAKLREWTQPTIKHEPPDLAPVTCSAVPLNLAKCRKPDKGTISETLEEPVNLIMACTANSTTDLSLSTSAIDLSCSKGNDADVTNAQPLPSTTEPVDLTLRQRHLVCCNVVSRFPFATACRAASPVITVGPSDESSTTCLSEDTMALPISTSHAWSLSIGSGFVASGPLSTQVGTTVKDAAVDLSTTTITVGVQPELSMVSGQLQDPQGYLVGIPTRHPAVTIFTHYGGSLRSSDGIIYSTIQAPLPATLPITTQPCSVLGSLRMQDSTAALPFSDTVPNLGAFLPQVDAGGASFEAAWAAAGGEFTQGMNGASMGAASTAAWGEEVHAFDTTTFDHSAFNPAAFNPAAWTNSIPEAASLEATWVEAPGGITAAGADHSHPSVTDPPSLDIAWSTPAGMTEVPTQPLVEPSVSLAGPTWPGWHQDDERQTQLLRQQEQLTQRISQLQQRLQLQLQAQRLQDDLSYPFEGSRPESMSDDSWPEGIPPEPIPLLDMDGAVHYGFSADTGSQQHRILPPRRRAMSASVSDMSLKDMDSRGSIRTRKDQSLPRLGQRYVAESGVQTDGEEGLDDGDIRTWHANGGSGRVRRASSCSVDSSVQTDDENDWEPTVGPRQQRGRTGRPKGAEIRRQIQPSMVNMACQTQSDCSVQTDIADTVLVPSLKATAQEFGAASTDISALEMTSGGTSVSCQTDTSHQMTGQQESLTGTTILQQTKLLQRSLSDPKSLSPTSADVQQQVKGSSGVVGRKVKRTLPNPPAEEAVPTTPSLPPSIARSTGTGGRKRAGRSGTLARAKLLQDIDRELEVVERESSKLRKRQAELDEEEKEIDAKLRYLEMGITRRKEALLKEREKRERAYLRGVAEERDYMSDSELSGGGGRGTTLLVAAPGVTGSRPQVTPVHQLTTYQEASSQPIPPQDRGYLPEPSYHPSPHFHPPYPTTYTGTEEFLTTSYQPIPQVPPSAAYQASTLPPAGSYSFHPDYINSAFLTLSGQGSAFAPPAYGTATTHSSHPHPQGPAAGYFSTGSTSAGPRFAVRTRRSMASVNDPTIFDNLDLRLALEEPMSPVSNLSAESAFLDLELAGGAVNAGQPFSAIEEADIVKSLAGYSGRRQAAGRGHYDKRRSVPGSYRTSHKPDDDASMKEPYELRLLKEQIKQEFQRGGSNLCLGAGSSSANALDHMYDSHQRPSTRPERYSHPPLRLDRHGQALPLRVDRYSIGRLTLEKEAAKQLGLPQAANRFCKSRKTGGEVRLSKFSPIEEAKDVEPDYAASYISSSAAVVTGSGVVLRAKRSPADAAYSLRRGMADKSVSRMTPGELDLLVASVHSRPSPSYGLEATGIRSRPSSRPASTYGLDPSTIRSRPSSSYGLDITGVHSRPTSAYSLEGSTSKSKPSTAYGGSETSTCSRPSSSYGLDSGFAVSTSRPSSVYGLDLTLPKGAKEIEIMDAFGVRLRNKPDTLPIIGPKGRLPIATQNSEEESPLSPVGQPMGMARAAAGPLPPIAADSREQFGSSHSLPEVQQHQKELHRRSYDHDMAYLMDDLQHAMSDSEEMLSPKAYHLRREDTNWFDKPRDSFHEEQVKEQLRDCHGTRISMRSFDFPCTRVCLRHDNKDHSISGNGFGIRIVGGKEIPGRGGEIGAYVSKVFVGRPAEKSKKLVEGMQVLEWNRQPLSGKTFEEVQQIVARPEKEVEICVRLDFNMLSDSGNPNSLNLQEYPVTMHKQKSPGVDPKQLAYELRKVAQGSGAANTEGEAAGQGCADSPTRPSSPATSTSVSSRKRHSKQAEVTKSANTVTGEIQLQFIYERQAENLLVHVLQARGLALRSDNTYSDPYVKVYLLPGRGQVMVVQNKSSENKRKTKHAQKSANPEWNQTVIYKNLPPEELRKKILEFTVWDYDRTSSNEFLGEVRIDLANTTHLDNTPRWYLLTEQSNGESTTGSGRLHGAPPPSDDSLPRHAVSKSKTHPGHADTLRSASGHGGRAESQKSKSSSGESHPSSFGGAGGPDTKGQRTHGPPRSQSKGSITQSHLENAGAAIAAAEAAVQQLRLQPTTENTKSYKSQSHTKKHRHSIGGVSSSKRGGNIHEGSRNGDESSSPSNRKGVSDGSTRAERGRGRGNVAAHIVAESSISGSSVSSLGSGSGYNVDSEGGSSANSPHSVTPHREPPRGRSSLAQELETPGQTGSHSRYNTGQKTEEASHRNGGGGGRLRESLNSNNSVASQASDGSGSSKGTISPDSPPWVPGRDGQGVMRLNGIQGMRHGRSDPPRTDLGPGQLLGAGKAAQVIGEMKLSLKKETKTDGDQLVVEVIQCRNITFKFKTPDHLPDLYIKVYVIHLASQKKVMKKKTRVCRHDREPLFNETFRFTVNPQGHSLQILLVSNGGKFVRKTLIGEAYIWLDQVDLKKKAVGWYKLLLSQMETQRPAVVP